MNLLQYLHDNLILIIPSNIKKKIIKYLNSLDKMYNIKILTMEELQEIKQETEDSNWGVINTDWSELDTLDEDEYEDFY